MFCNLKSSLLVKEKRRRFELLETNEVVFEPCPTNDCLPLYLSERRRLSRSLSALSFNLVSLSLRIRWRRDAWWTNCATLSLIIATISEACKSRSKSKQGIRLSPHLCLHHTRFNFCVNGSISECFEFNFFLATLSLAVISETDKSRSKAKQWIRLSPHLCLRHTRFHFYKNDSISEFF